jgi:hypothetical protein
MENDQKKDVNIGFTLPQASPSELKGKQSVRTTFKLSEKTIDAVSIVAAHLGIKQKSLFDSLIDDFQSLCSIAVEIQRAEPKIQNRIQKTYVISRKSLYSLEKVSTDYDAPRDALIEYLAQGLLPIINREREKHNKRKEILHELTEYLNRGKKILKRSKALLGEDDPVYVNLAAAMAVCATAFRKIDAFIERGKIIEDF